MKKRYSRLPPSWSRRRDDLSLSRGGKVRLLVGGRNRREILIALDGFLPAKLAARENEHDCYRGDDAADDNAEPAASIVFHDIHSTFAATRGSGAASCVQKSAEIVAKFGPFGGNGLHGKQFSFAKTCGERFAHELSKLAAHRMNR